MWTKGQSLVELIVVIAVGVIVVAAITIATLASLRNAQFAKNQAQATKLAQEGIERVRAGRDRNAAIVGLSTSVSSWNGNPTGALWNYRISNGNCGNLTLAPPTYCYFNVNSFGALNHIGVGPQVPSLAESIDNFQRVIILSDEASLYQTEKIVTVIVKWSDFSGPHESRLTTILRKL